MPEAELSDRIPSTEIDGGMIRIAAGTYHRVNGPVDDIVIDPELFVLKLDTKDAFTHQTARGYTFFTYILEGSIAVREGREIEHEHLVLLESGKEVTFTAGDSGALCLVVSGRPLEEPIAWAGPIVMNTQEELRRAFHEFGIGTFLKRSS